jgi:hypothetical protein
MSEADTKLRLLARQCVASSNIAGRAGLISAPNGEAEALAEAVEESVAGAREQGDWG